MVNPNKQLEQIQIPKFLANKVKYVTRRAAFSSCIDETSLSPQFKILQWESHLADEVAEMAKGLSYSLAA